MNARPQSLRSPGEYRPAPPNAGASTIGRAFGLIGGPLAWFIQLCAGYGLASWPCFPKDQRLFAPFSGFAWTWPAMLAVLIAGVLLALCAFWVSWRIYTATRSEVGGDYHRLMEGGRGRTPYLALWGMLLGAGFAITTLLTAIAYGVLPRCAA
ncbi:MAG TPA: hypothetical protein VIY54_01600 [Steroidobacteraceae bacterium]